MRIQLPRDPDYRRAVEALWERSQVQEMALYLQHGTTSCLEHCLRVSYLSYCYCRDRGLDADAAARGGLLHDLFLYDWHHFRRARGELPHGFTHPRRALENAERLFSLSAVEKDIILHHMWPLTWSLPTSPEARAVMMFDKYVSFLETVRLPVPLERRAQRT